MASRQITSRGLTRAYLGRIADLNLLETNADTAKSLAPLRNTTMRRRADLIAFNKAHCAEEMKYFGQEWFRVGRNEGRSA